MWVIDNTTFQIRMMVFISSHLATVYVLTFTLLKKKKSTEFKLLWDLSVVFLYFYYGCYWACWYSETPISIFYCLDTNSFNYVRLQDRFWFQVVQCTWVPDTVKTMTNYYIFRWIFPFIGHMGIATSAGVIRDFAGSYFVSEDHMGFGKTSFAKLKLIY